MQTIDSHRETSRAGKRAAQASALPVRLRPSWHRALQMPSEHRRLAHFGRKRVPVLDRFSLRRHVSLDVGGAQLRVRIDVQEVEHRAEARDLQVLVVALVGSEAVVLQHLRIALVLLELAFHRRKSLAAA
eukprot:scaffold4501_cov320-Pinguiococcus_pyrenoidosus.AAC.1